MPRNAYFRSPAEEAAVRIARAIRGRGAVSKIARLAEVPERTASRWMKHPKMLIQVENVIALLWAAEVPKKTIMKILKRRGA